MIHGQAVIRGPPGVPLLTSFGFGSLLALGYVLLGLAGPIQVAGPGVGVPNHRSTSLRVHASTT